jgi:hypothetical protein
VATQGIDRLRSLPDQEFADAEDRASAAPLVRAPWRGAAPWVSSLFTGTKRIVGLCAASQIASASAASFFWRLTKGFT